MCAAVRYFQTTPLPSMSRLSECSGCLTVVRHSTSQRRDDADAIRTTHAVKTRRHIGKDDDASEDSVSSWENRFHVKVQLIRNYAQIVYNSHGTFYQCQGF
ncbi:hypothetical protein TNCV_4727231 [Trichonephila clavipes]|nr:hypothetical protein TNCV_4727231 [Trichonephila clavipes]